MKFQESNSSQFLKKPNSTYLENISCRKKDELLRFLSFVSDFMITIIKQFDTDSVFAVLEDAYIADRMTCMQKA